MKTYFLAMVVVLGFAVIASAELQTTDRVDDFGDRKAIVAKGAKTFPADDILDAIFSNRDVLLAAHPVAPRSDYLIALQKAVTAGYEHAGFPDAKVSASIDGNHVQLSIDEGRRLMCGAIQVDSAVKIPIDRLTARLKVWHLPADASADPEVADASPWQPLPETAGPTNNTAPNSSVTQEPPDWFVGKPAPFDDHTQNDLHNKINVALNDLGYYYTCFTCKVVPDEKTKSAVLTIHIVDEGPAGSVEKIEVQGNQRDSRERILKFLHIRPGMAFDRVERSRIERLLYQSGRYWSYKVSPQLSATAGKIDLQIEVAEYAGAPRIEEQLSREVKALLRARDWLIHPERHEADVQITCKSPDIEMEVVFSKRGWLTVVREPATTEAKSANAKGKPLWAALLTPSDVGFINFESRRRITAPCSSDSIITISLASTYDGKKAEGERFTSVLGVFPSSRVDGDRRSFLHFVLRMAPVYFVAYEHELKPKFKWQGNRLTADLPDQTLELDAQTGQIIHWRAAANEVNDSKDQSFKGIDGCCKKGLAESLQREIESASAGFPNSFNAERPLHSVADMLWDDELLWKGVRTAGQSKGNYDAKKEKQIRKTGRRLIDLGILEPIDRWLVEQKHASDKKSEEFVVLSDNVATGVNVWNDLIGACQQYPLNACDDLFPRKSWPWTIGREVTLNLSGNSQYYNDELRRLAAMHDKGPVGCLVTARLMRLRGVEGYREVAAEGLQHLTAADFRRDWKAALPPDRWLAKSFYRVAEMLRDCDEYDVDILAETIQDERALLLVIFAEKLRHQRGKPIAEGLDAMLDDYWNSTLRSETKRLLREVGQSD